MNVIFLTLFLFIFAIQNSHALINTKITTNNLPAVLKANKIDGDQFSGVIVATGNVEVSKNNSVIYADKVLYNKNSKIISGIGNVVIKNLEVGKLLGPDFTIKDDFSSGLFLNSKIFFNDGSYIFSKKISKISPEKSMVNKFNFSICPNEDIANDNKKAGNVFDFATIFSNEALIDQEKKSISSWNSLIKIYNVPVLYIPYINVALPSKKRQSGFLKPSYARNSNFGFGIRTPYFIEFGDSIDLTITPLYFFSSKQIIIGNQIRHYTDFGKYNFNIDFANNKLITNFNRIITKNSNKKIRWQIYGDGKFDFTKNLGLDFEIKTLSDKDYLKDYNFEFSPAYTLSKINLDYIFKRNYYSIKTLKFQEIEYSNNIKNAPFILPSIDIHAETEPLFFKEKFSIDSNITILNRDNGLQYKRLSIIPQFKIPFNLKGNLIEFSSKIQRDEYLLNSKIMSNEINNYNKRTADTKSEFSVNWSLPLKNKSKDKSITIEPMVNFVTSNFYTKNNQIPIEDSVNSELTFSNLFSNDRISGFDRNEAGKRISYGIKSSIFNDFGEFNLTSGQAFIIKEKQQDIKIRGFANNNKSNIVGIASFKAKKYYTISYAFQLNQSSYRNEINQLYANFDFDKIIFNIDYLLIRKSLFSDQKKEQATLNSILKLPYKWQLKLFTTQDLIIKRNIQKGLEIKRVGCCTDFSFYLIENNPSNLRKPQKNFKIEFTFKNI